MPELEYQNKSLYRPTQSQCEYNHNDSKQRKNE